jgi:cobalamin biosynthetic protein CobC
VAIAGPTYSEHAIAWSRTDRIVSPQAGWLELARADVAVVVNPNNPDGRLIERPQIAALADDLAKRRGVLIVDEAFCDITPEASAVPLAARDNLIVLRSFGKFFGLAGLRLGFCIGAPAFAGRLADALGPWAVSGPALEIGARALTDAAWIGQTRARLAAQRARLQGVLAGAGLRIVGGTDLFCLIDSPSAGVLHRHLGAAGILVRRFADQPRWLRFGLPGDDAGLARLAAALSGYAASSR